MLLGKASEGSARGLFRTAILQFFFGNAQPSSLTASSLGFASSLGLRVLLGPRSVLIPVLGRSRWRASFASSRLRTPLLLVLLAPPFWSARVGASTRVGWLALAAIILAGFTDASRLSRAGNNVIVGFDKLVKNLILDVAHETGRNFIEYPELGVGVIALPKLMACATCVNVGSTVAEFAYVGGVLAVKPRSIAILGVGDSLAVDESILVQMFSFEEAMVLPFALLEATDRAGTRGHTLSAVQQAAVVAEVATPELEGGAKVTAGALEQLLVPIGVGLVALRSVRKSARLTVVLTA